MVRVAAADRKGVRNHYVAEKLPQTCSSALRRTSSTAPSTVVPKLRLQDAVPDDVAALCNLARYPTIVGVGNQLCARRSLASTPGTLVLHRSKASKLPWQGFAASGHAAKAPIVIY